MNIKQIGSLFTICLISSFFACNLPVSNDTNKVTWQKNVKNAFCGKEFISSKTIKAIDMTVKTVTVFNCNGTYTSKEDWGTSQAHEEDYRNTVGRSEGNNSNFSGTWEIVEKNLPSEVDSYFRNGGFNENEYTVIRYHSNTGKVRYAFIQYMEEKSLLFNGLVTFARDNNEDNTYKEEDLDMYSGLAYL